MILLELFLTFVKIGLFAFGGGYAALPLIQQFVVVDKGWLSMVEMIDLVSISQMTPGPIAINSATFVGTKVAGISGAIVATLGNVTPQFILMMVLSYFIFRDKKIGFLDKMIKGLKPGIVGLIAVAALSMIVSSLFKNSVVSFISIEPLAIVCFVIAFYLFRVKKMDIILLIIVGAVLSAIVYFASVL